MRSAALTNSPNGGVTLDKLVSITAAENKSQRTFNKGSKHANAKLTDAIAVRILRTNAPAMDHLFAKQFNVSRETIRDVRLGKTWRHVNV